MPKMAVGTDRDVAICNRTAGERVGIEYVSSILTV